MKKQFDKDLILYYYNIQKMSLKTISDKLECHPDTLKKRMIEFGIEVDSKRRYRNIQIKLTAIQKEILDGGLLGDAHLTKVGAGNSQISYVSSVENHVKFFQSFFNDFSAKECVSGPIKTETFDKRTKKIYTSYRFRSILNITFSNYRNNWYKNNVKYIPRNLKLTSNTCLMWYLGDGGLCQNYKTNSTTFLKLSVNSFCKEDVENTLIPQLFNFEPILSRTEKGHPIILIPRRKIEEFLNYIGKCPFEEYKHKWLVFPYKNKNIEKNGFKYHDDNLNIIANDFKTGDYKIYELHKKYNVPINSIKNYFNKNKIKWEAIKVKKNILQFDLEGNFIKEWSSGSEISKVLGYDCSAISACCRGIRKSHKKFIWKFK